MCIRRISRWHQFRRLPNYALSAEWRSWLLDKGSLTKRLIKASNGQFSVKIVRQYWGYPELNECSALGMRSREIALIREVALCCKGEIWVRARSIIPKTTLSGEERLLQHLGTRPLGAFLFKSKAMERKEIEVAAFETSEAQQMFGRRSVFLLHNKPLLVSELFLPQII